MKKINILESLLELDKKSSNRYELATLYEACKLKDEDKYQLVKYINSYEHPSLIGEFLKSKCDGICESVCDDDDCTDIECLKKTVDDINDNEVPVIFAFDDFEEIEEKESLNEEIVIDDSKAAQKYVWNKVKEIDSITDDDSMYWQFDDGIRQGDSAKIITDETDIPDSANYKFSFVEVNINMYYSWDEECWYVLDKTYKAPVVEESFETHNCPVCGRSFVEGELGNNCCPKCGEKLHKTDSGEYELNDRDIDEDLEKDLKRRYTISDAHTSKCVLSNIEELKASDLIKEIEPVVKYDTQVFVMTATDGRVFYLVPSTMSQFDVYDADENLITKSEFAKYIVDEVLSDKSNLEFVYQIVGGGFSGIYSREEIEALPCFSGNYTDDQSDIRANGGFTSREELDNQPKLDGYVGPMMDGWRNHKMVLRYETQEIYDALSEAFFELEQDWTDYCPHCTNRTLVGVGDDKAVCDECGAEFEVVPMADGKVRIMEINELTEGFIDDVKKVGKTVKDIAKERWNDSYTKAIATGVKKNLFNTRLAKDLKRIGDSVKDTDTYKKVTGEVNKLKDMKRDNNRKPEEISFNVKGKSYRASDLKYKLNGKAISAEEVAKMGSLERKNIQMIVPRGTKPVKEEFGYHDDEAFTKEEVIAQLKAELPNLGNEGVVRYGFISEAEVARDFLSKYYALAELDSVGSWFQIDYADPFKNEEVIQMNADEMKAKFGTDNPDIINCGRPEEDGTIELKKSENDIDNI